MNKTAIDRNNIYQVSRVVPNVVGHQFLEEKISQIRRGLPILDPILEIDQCLISAESLVRKIRVILEDEPSQNKRVLALGDFDRTGALFSAVSKAKDVVIMDIDTRLAESLFELQMSFDAPVRFVYHDARKKLIEVLSHQFDMIITDAPPTVHGINLFLSRAIAAGKKDIAIKSKHQFSVIFFALPKEKVLLKHLETIAEKAFLTIENKWEIIDYSSPFQKGLLVKLRVQHNSTPLIKGHYLGPLYTHEVSMEPQPWECQCGNTITVGKHGNIESLSLLQEQGCPQCSSKGPFRFASRVPIK